jgi:RNA polymerase sigma factor (sigma-70 family)
MSQPASAEAPPPDSEVIAASVWRPEAFGLIFDRYAGSVLRFFTRRIGPDEAGALTGEVFRIAFERRAAFRSEAVCALPWLYGIAANQVRNFRRSQARRLRAMAGSLAGNEAGHPHDGLDARLMLPRMAALIDQLAEEEREALLLFALEELSYAEIAAALQTPLGTVRSRISRARARLRALIEGVSR